MPQPVSLEESHPNALWDECLDALHEEPLNEMERPKKSVAYWA